MHDLVVRDAHLLDRSAWYRRCTRTGRKLLQAAAEKGLYPPPERGPDRKEVAIRTTEEASRAERTALVSFEILVENDRSDKLFLEEVARKLASDVLRERWFSPGVAVDPPAVVVSGPGGHGELRPAVDRRLEEARDRDRPVRVFVVADSDAERPGEPKDHASAIEDHCTCVGIPVHILRKRTAENYIPDRAWQRWADEPEHTNVRPKVDAMLRLTPPQRDHVNLASGDPWAVDNDLFAGVGCADRQLLTHDFKGHGDRRAILLLRDQREALNPADYDERDRHHELEGLLARIADEL